MEDKLNELLDAAENALGRVISYCSSLPFNDELEAAEEAITKYLDADGKET